MREQNERLACGFFLITAAWSLIAALLGSTEALLFLAPALLLALPLALGRFLGEDKLARLRARHRQPRARTATAICAVAASRVRTLLPRGGALIAAALAKRPPPHLLQQP
jgi:hypothetical protein